VGTEMMTVADMSVIEVRVDVGENDIVKVNIGDSADIEVDAYNNRKFKGTVTKIASSTNSTSLTSGSTQDVTNYEVRIRLDSNSYKDLIKRSGDNKKFPFRPGMNASADIKTMRKDNVLAVPITAVNARVKNSDQSLADKKKEKEANAPDQEQETKPAMSGDEGLEEVVFVLQPNNTVKKMVVKSGIQDVNYIEITTGLKEGDQVVTGPYTAVSKSLKEGSKVNVVPKEKLFEKK